jgi:hypothetical protein
VLEIVLQRGHFGAADGRGVDVLSTTRSHNDEMTLGIGFDNARFKNIVGKIWDLGYTIWL